MSACAATDSQPLVLVLNAGSSSLKAQVLNGEGASLWRGQCDWRGGMAGADDGAETALRDWLRPAMAPWARQVSLVGHRVVHGGLRFTAPTAITPEVHVALSELVPLAPLHNGPALAMIGVIGRWRPELPQWACFDTAFHHTLPPEAFTYAIPVTWREQGLRRYGFHGLNHQHVSEVVPAGRLISCHLGAGCSLCAIADGRSVATTMGFTPMEGLVMATRSGTVDPGLLLHLLRQGMGVEQLDRELNHASGLLALSEGLSGSMKELREAADAGHAAAGRAIAVFRQRLLQGIGAMAASLGGVDAIALSGGIGEHDQRLRQELERELRWLPPHQLVVVAADEEGLIARQCSAAAARLGAAAPGRAAEERRSAED